MSFEDNIESTEQLRHDPNHKFLVYGPPGAGKTYMIRTLDGPALVGSCESGLSSLLDEDINFVQIDTIATLREMYGYLAGDDHDYEWAVLDSVSEMGAMCLAEMKKKHKDGRQAYGEMQDTVRGLLRAFRELDMNVYFSAKQQRENVDGRLMYMPSMPGKTLTTKEPIGHDFDYVFPLVLSRDDEGNVQRQLLTEGDHEYQAKARDVHHVLDRWEEPHLGRIRQKLIDSYTKQ